MTPRDADRYSRQIRFAAIGESGQQKLLDARVAIVGCGALGSFHAGALARAGIGYLRLIDRDYVELSNLQRQWLFDESDAAAALPKAVAAARAIRRINSGVQADPVVSDLVPDNAAELFEAIDLILDGSDNFETRYLINDYSVSRGVPWIYGAAVGSYGITMPVVPGKSSCLQCVYPEPPSGPQQTCETAGILGSATSIVASLQVSEAIRLVCSGETSGKLTRLDVWSGEIRQLSQPERDLNCPACAHGRFIHLESHERTPISMCGRDAVQIHERRRPLDLEQLAVHLAPVGQVRSNEFALRFETPPYVLTVFPDGRVIVKGTTDIGVARSVYAKYIGN